PRALQSRGRQVLSRPITRAFQRRSAPRTILRATLAAVMMGAAVTAALAQTTPLPQTVPLPKPAPKARGAAVPSDGGPSSTSTASPTYAGTPPAAVAAPVVRPQPQAAPQQQQQGSFLPDPRKLFGLGGSTISFDANQRALAAKMSTYLSSLSTLSGNFVQVGPNGGK